MQLPLLEQRCSLEEAGRGQSQARAGTDAHSRSVENSLGIPDKQPASMVALRESGNLSRTAVAGGSKHSSAAATKPTEDTAASTDHKRRADFDEVGSNSALSSDRAITGKLVQEGVFLFADGHEATVTLDIPWLEDVSAFMPCTNHCCLIKADATCSAQREEEQAVQRVRRAETEATRGTPAQEIRRSYLTQMAAET